MPLICWRSNQSACDLCNWLVFWKCIYMNCIRVYNFLLGLHDEFSAESGSVFYFVRLNSAASLLYMMHVEKIPSKAKLLSSFISSPFSSSSVLPSSPSLPPLSAPLISSPPSGGSVGYCLHPNHPGVHHGEHHRYLDYSGPQTHEDCD